MSSPSERVSRDLRELYSCGFACTMVGGSLKRGCGGWGHLRVRTWDSKSKPRSGCLQGNTPCWETMSSIGFGAAPHLFFPSWESLVTRWSCSPVLSKSEVFLTQEMQAVPAGWSTSALTCGFPGRRREEPTSALASPLWAAQQGFTTPQPSPPRRQFRWKGLPWTYLLVKLCFTFPDSLESLPSWRKQEHKDRRQCPHSRHKGFSSLRAPWGQTCLARLSSVPWGKWPFWPEIYVSDGFSPHPCLPHAHLAVVPLAHGLPVCRAAKCLRKYLWSAICAYLHLFFLKICNACHR